VHELGQRLLRSAGYRGLAHVEFAYDARDSTFRLIEVNTRVPIWISLATRPDFDIVRIAYDDLAGRPPAQEARPADGGVWIDLTKDLIQAARGGGFHPAPYLRRPKARGWFAADDPAPALAWLDYLGRRGVERMRGRR
jgi:predicted ATP-grasp superfamily ATP-dependent carboligase